MLRLKHGAFGILAWLFAAAHAGAAENPEPEDDDMGTKLNVASKTLGGRQFWGDVRLFRGWRVQQNVFSGHYRLLDPKDVRRAWGTQAECCEALDRFRQEQKLEPMSGKAVLMLHGIGRSSKSMRPLEASLTEAGYIALSMDYPSTRGTVQESAEYLKRVLDSLDGITEVNIIVHSMGGIVVRTYLQQVEQPDPRLHRMVMIGSPNTGAHLVDLLQDKVNVVFKPLYGPAGQQLGTSSEGFVAKLPVPKFEFAVIAGGRGNDAGFNPLIPGDDDGIVSVSSTRLPGASDFMLVPAIHSLMLFSPDVSAACVRFLKDGALRVDGERQPIPAAMANAQAVAP